MTRSASGRLPSSSASRIAAPGPVLSLFLAFVLASCDGGPEPTGLVAPEEPDSHSVAGTRIGPGVAEAVEREGGARVMVALDPAAVSAPVRDREGAGEGPADRSGVQEVVDVVLERVGTNGFALDRRFHTVPALAATVRSPAALARLAADPAVLRVDLDVGGGGALAETVTHVGADQRRAMGNDGEGVVVAVLDTGVDTGHPALAGRILHQACFGTGSGGSGFCPAGGTRQTGAGAAEDDAGHGTHVIGIVASNGTVGGPGVAPAAGIVAVKVMNNCSFEGCFNSFSEIVAALDYLIVHHADLRVRVINMSLGTNALFEGVCDQTTAFNIAGSQAIDRLRELGVIAFASSMNNASGTSMASPACLEHVVAVGAVDREDRIPGFSNGNAATALVAPGVQVQSLAMGGGLLVVSGTSMASPHAAGCAALLLHSNPTMAPAAVVARLRESDVLVTDPKNGFPYRRLDCRPDPAPPPPDPGTVTPVERPGA